MTHLSDKSPFGRPAIAAIVAFPPDTAVVANVFLYSGISLTDKGIPALSDELKHAMCWHTAPSILNANARCARFHIHPNKFLKEILACISTVQQLEKTAVFVTTATALATSAPHSATIRPPLGRSATLTGAQSNAQ